MSRRRLSLALMLLAAMPGPARAAPISISFTLPTLAQITGLTDVTFTNVDPNVDAAQSQNDCVWTNSLTRAYTVTATGSGSASAFTLNDGQSNTVPYAVAWAATSGATSGTGLAASTPSAAFTSGALTPGCTLAPSTSSTLFVTIVKNDLQTMIGGRSYTGTLTLVITPQ